MIVGISGKKGSGKTTVAQYLESRIEGAQRLPFAFRLKQLAQECYGATLAQVNGTEDQKNTLTPCGLTGRELLQRLGHGMREIWSECWVTAWESEVVGIWAEAGSPLPIIVEDVRYANEAATIKRMGGIVIRLTRHPWRDGHESETGLDDFDQFDEILDNDMLTEIETCECALSICREHGVI